jgi:hypothetical protein
MTTVATIAEKKKKDRGWLHLSKQNKHVHDVLYLRRHQMQRDTGVSESVTTQS